jgi:hypothetical protein
MASGKTSSNTRLGAAEGAAHGHSKQAASGVEEGKQNGSSKAAANGLKAR